MALPKKQTEGEAVIGAGEIIPRCEKRRLQV
jgi:hypothetical protein